MRGAPTQTHCTMGFHVQLKSNTATKAFLSAGHCSYNASSNWYMEEWAGPVGNGFIGSVRANRYKDVGEDCMAVAMPSSQVSRSIYDTSRAVSGVGTPVDGETIYMSAGMSDEESNTNIIHATVYQSTISYISNELDEAYIIHGARATQWKKADGTNWNTVPGDSGSPIYRAPSSGGAVALGLHSTALRHFARVKDCIDLMGYSIN